MSKLSQQGGALLLGFVCALIGASRPAAAQTSTLPSGWSHGDIGSPVVAGNATSSGSTFTVVGAGTDVGGRSDEFHFAYQPTSGDLDVRVKVATLQNVDPGAKAGLMIRESLTDDARHAFMYVSAGNGLGFQQRTRTGHTSSETAGAATSAPVWLRLVRQGNVFSAYSSPTGATWTLVDSATVSMNAQAYVGLAVTSHVASKTATASFANVTLGSSSAASLPSPWTAGDIGSPALVGSASASGGIFTVKGSGQDIWGTSDQFQFAYQQMTGNAEVVARVASLQAADVWTKGGVMIREGLTGPAAHVSMFATGSSGWAFQRRLSAGGTSYTSAGGSGAAPGWVRVVREGNLFSAYQSQDGSPMDARRQRHGLDAGHGLRRACRHQPQPGRDGDSDVQQRRRQHADERQQAADRLDLRSCKRRELHGAGQHRHRCNRRRHRRIDREGRFLRGHPAPRIGFVEPIHLHVEQCRGRNIQPDRGCHRQRRRENDVSGDYRQRHVSVGAGQADNPNLRSADGLRDERDVPHPRAPAVHGSDNRSSSGQQEPGQADAFEWLGIDGYLDARRSAPGGIVLRGRHQRRPVWIDEERSVAGLEAP